MGLHASATTPGPERRDAPASLHALPPAVARPVQWRRLGRQLAILWESDPAKVLDAAFSTGDSIGGMSDERQIRRVLATPEGRRLAAERPSLTDALADQDALAGMPEGSVGRAFLAFSRRHALEPRKLIESQHLMSRDYRLLDPLRQWFSDRFTAMHDLWHVLCGYDATHAGESALMAFSLPQRVNDRALPIFVGMSILSGRIHPGDARDAMRRGRRAGLLSAAPFERMLPERLGAVRARLGIGDPREVHARVRSKGMLIPVATGSDS